MTDWPDVVVRNGRVIDGSGRPPRRADVAIRDGRVVHVGDLSSVRAAETIDAEGLAVAPGFIDAHVHSEAKLEDEAVQRASLAQGVTTHVVGQDGFGFAPTSPASFDFMAAYTSGINGSDPPFGPMSVGELLGWFDGRSPLNVATLVPNGCLRLQAAELEAMTALCARSVGYELGLRAALEEAFAVGHAAGVPVHVSHLRPDRALELSADEIVGYVEAGGDVTYDLYPYTFSSTLLPFLLPHWVFDGDLDEIFARLARAETRDAIRRARAESRWGWNDATIAGAPSAPYAELVGLGLEDAAARLGADPADFACDFLLAERLACLLVWRDHETERDRRELAAMLRPPAAMVGSDGIYSGGRARAATARSRASSASSCATRACCRSRRPCTA